MGKNSLQCTKCNNCVHRTCSGLQGRITNARNFICKRCHSLVNVCQDTSVILDGDDIEKVDKFCYLKDDLSTKGGVQGAII